MDQQTVQSYTVFAKNLQMENNDYNITIYSRKTLPSIYKCRVRDACIGQQGNPANSVCSKGAHGPLCEQCNDSYFFTNNGCASCPSKWRVILQSVGFMIVMFLLVGLLSWKQTKSSQREEPLDEDGHTDVEEQTGTWLDSLIAALRVGIGFVQVINGITMALLFVPWPSGIETIGRYLAEIEFNVLEVINPVCISSKLRLDHLQKTVAFVVIVSGLILTVFIAYWLWKAHMAWRKHNVTYQLRQTALQLCFNATLWIVFACYPALAQYIIATVPYRQYSCIRLNCTQGIDIPSNSSECQWYLKADVSVLCNDSNFSSTLWKVCTSFLVLVFGIPLLTLVLLYVKHRKASSQQRPSGPFTTALFVSLSFLDGSYHPKFWYWEVLEMFRKLVLTSGLQFFGEGSATELAVASILAMVFAVLHAHLRPMKKSLKWQHYLQLVSLLVIALNVMLGVLKMTDSESNDAHSTKDGSKVLFAVLFYFVNGLFALFFIGNNYSSYSY